MNIDYLNGYKDCLDHLGNVVDIAKRERHLSYKPVIDAVSTIHEEFLKNYNNMVSEYYLSEIKKNTKSE